ncbi:hypothetical protein HYX14_04380 [Candidatus Woesearchaeota archaeon]|nr:hypothetical protein [Candidatus Woesearchaeota archaeon]
MVNRYSLLEVTLLYEYDQMIKSTIPTKKTKTDHPKAKIKKERYLRNESAYNAHQENEFIFFITTLPFIVFSALAEVLGIKPHEEGYIYPEGKNKLVIEI